MFESFITPDARIGKNKKKIMWIYRISIYHIDISSINISYRYIEYQYIICIYRISIHQMDISYGYIEYGYIEYQYVEYRWNSMRIDENRWESMKINENKWFLMIFTSFLMVFNRFKWKLVRIRPRTWFFEPAGSKNKPRGPWEPLGTPGAPKYIYLYIY